MNFVDDNGNEVLQLGSIVKLAERTFRNILSRLATLHIATLHISKLQLYEITSTQRPTPTLPLKFIQ